MSLLPLPTPCEFALVEGVAMQGCEYRRLSTSFEPNTAMYSPEQMQAYGQACRDAALEEAAVGIETNDVSEFKDDAYMLAYTTHLLVYFAKYLRNLK